MGKLLTPLTEERVRGLDDRLHSSTAKESPGKSYRTPAQRDRDRVLYAGALQRLASVTQVTASESGHTFHNRLSHSLKVAQVGRRNAERLQSLVRSGEITGEAARLMEALDADAVEASCLAHDLGHPPFGHIAETVLNNLAKDCDLGFNGNAQSFRIVTRLAVRAEEPGLNLTRRTLDGLLKYPWAHRHPDPHPLKKRERVWGYYREDSEAFEFARAGWPTETASELPERSLAAEIMDWADDLTYAVHDVDDFFRAGLIPLDRLRLAGTTGELRRLTLLLEEARQADPAAFPPYDIDELVDAVQRKISLRGPSAPYAHTQPARANMREFGSHLITDYLEAFSVENDSSSGQPVLLIEKSARREVEAMKMLVTAYVIRRPGLAVMQHGQQRVVEDLFNFYMEASAEGKEGDRRIFPPGPKERLDKCDDSRAERAKIVIDLISGLTEQSALTLHERLSGGASGATLDATAAIG